MATVELRHLVKRFGDIAVVAGIDLAIADGEFVVLVGPSGCGKSTLLRMIAGLENITSGDLVIAGARANDVPPQRRNISMVFQSYALYPHMTAYENIAYGPRLRREPAPEIKAKVGRAGILNLHDYLERLPKQLSGGQRQRVAMGRAITRDPAVFLFDEPLSNLDAKLRIHMRTEIKALHQRLGSTVVYVTHDQIEAMTLADRIVVMNHGRVEQLGEPLELYDRPANLFVAGFLGAPSMTFLPGRFSAGTVETADGTKLPAPTVGAVTDGQAVVLGIRPEDYELVGAEDGAPATVEVVEPTGADTHIYGRLGGEAFTAVFASRQKLAPGDQLHLRPREGRAHLFDQASERRLQ